MNIEHTHGDTDRQCNQNHCKKKIFSEQWDRKRSWRNNLSQKQKEHSQREQNGDAQCDLIGKKILFNCNFNVNF